MYRHNGSLYRCYGSLYRKRPANRIFPPPSGFQKIVGKEVIHGAEAEW
jgi:hypothetical protein